MKESFEFVRCHLTKILGLLQGCLAAVAAVPGVIPAEQLPKWMAALAVLTFARGYLAPVQPQKQQ